MTALASAAVRFALRGLAVFPLAPGTKVPLAGSHGVRDATMDCDVIRARLSRNPTANIGIATGRKSGLWVLDYDPRHGGDKSLAELEREHGRLPATVQVATPSNGCHYYWRWPASGREIRNTAGRIGLGLDVLGEGGSVVAPPSVLADGRRYRWVETGARVFAEAPGWLVEAALPPPPPPGQEPKPLTGDVSAYVASAVAAELQRLEIARVGSRNDTLNKVAFAIAQFVKSDALPEDWARTKLERLAVAIGLPAVEARDTIASAFRAAHPRSLPR